MKQPAEALIYRGAAVATLTYDPATGRYHVTPRARNDHRLFLLAESFADPQKARHAVRVACEIAEAAEKRKPGGNPARGHQGMRGTGDRPR